MSKEKPTTKALARARAQRARVLTAAQSCFVESGFHAASMANIAESAGMSPGLIYRYFENKNAIILAIIEQHLTIARRRIRELQSPTHLTKRIVDFFDEQEAAAENSINSMLYLEISAQATRDPQIAEAVKRFDIAVCSELADWLSRSRDDGGYGVPIDIAPTRALVLMCLIEGLKVRSRREPDPDRELLGRTIEGIIGTLVN